MLNISEMVQDVDTHCRYNGIAIHSVFKDVISNDLELILND